MSASEGTLRAVLSEAVPYNRHLALEVVEVAAEGSLVRLPDRPYLLNHVGTQHAGALFSVGEAASGGVVFGLLGERIAQITPVARSAEIAYRKPARGAISARARLVEPAEAILARLTPGAKVDTDVEVSLSDETGLEVATMKVRWHLRRST